MMLYAGLILTILDQNMCEKESADENDFIMQLCSYHHVYLYMDTVYMLMSIYIDLSPLFPNLK